MIREKARTASSVRAFFSDARMAGETRWVTVTRRSEAVSSLGVSLAFHEYRGRFGLEGEGRAEHALHGHLRAFARRPAIFRDDDEAAGPIVHLVGAGSEHSDRAGHGPGDLDALAVILA